MAYNVVRVDFPYLSSVSVWFSASYLYRQQNFADKVLIKNNMGTDLIDT